MAQILTSTSNSSLTSLQVFLQEGTPQLHLATDWDPSYLWIASRQWVLINAHTARENARALMPLKTISECILERSHLGAQWKDVLWDSNRKVSNTVIWEIGISLTQTCSPKGRKAICCPIPFKSPLTWVDLRLTSFQKGWPLYLIKGDPLSPASAWDRAFRCQSPACQD